MLTPGQMTQISIHAPRVGSDDFCSCANVCGTLISIHAPRVGSDSTRSEFYTANG